MGARGPQSHEGSRSRMDTQSAKGIEMTQEIEEPVEQPGGRGCEYQGLCIMHGIARVIVVVLLFTCACSESEWGATIVSIPFTTIPGSPVKALAATIRLSDVGVQIEPYDVAPAVRYEVEVAPNRIRGRSRLLDGRTLIWLPIEPTRWDELQAEVRAHYPNSARESFSYSVIVYPDKSILEIAIGPEPGQLSAASRAVVDAARFLFSPRDVLIVGPLEVANVGAPQIDSRRSDATAEGAFVVRVGDEPTFELRVNNTYEDRNRALWYFLRSTESGEGSGVLDEHPDSLRVGPWRLAPGTSRTHAIAKRPNLFIEWIDERTPRALEVVPIEVDRSIVNAVDWTFPDYEPTAGLRSEDVRLVDCDDVPLERGWIRVGFDSELSPAIGMNTTRNWLVLFRWVEKPVIELYFPANCTAIDIQWTSANPNDDRKLSTTVAPSSFDETDGVDLRQIKLCSG